MSVAHKPKIPSLEGWNRPKNLKEHRTNVAAALYQISGGMIFLDNDFLAFHQIFRASNNRIVVVITPWPGQPNFCLNLRDRDKLLETYKESELSILFAKFEPCGFCVYAYKFWEEINFDKTPIIDGREFGPYRLITRTFLDKLGTNLNEFEILFPQKSEQLDATPPPKPVLQLALSFD